MMKWIFCAIYFLFYTVFLSAADIAVITIAQGQEYQNLVQLGIENKRTYCKKHGYDFIYCEDSLDTSRHIYWSKILLTLQTLKNSSYKWVVWMDADTLVMNLDIPIEDMIDDKYHFFIAADINGINSGVYFVKNCEWSYQFLNSVYDRTDCFSYSWPEQTAISLELQREIFRSYSKVYPQRVFNAFPADLYPAVINGHYQPGDFLIHFAGARGDLLSYFFNKYSQLVLDDRKLLTLDQYLSYYGIQQSSVPSDQNVWYLSDEQKKQFKRRLNHYPHIKRIVEIGLKGGDRIENFFQCCKKLKKFVSFDSNTLPYTEIAAEYFSHKYKKRYKFIPGDLTVTVPEYAERFPSQKFDLIYLNASQSYEGCVRDILNCQKFAHSNTFLWVDNYRQIPDVPSVPEAIAWLQEQRILDIKRIFSLNSPQGEGGWVEARFLFAEERKNEQK